MTIRAVLLDAGNTLMEINYEFVSRAIRAAGGDADAAEVRRAERHARVRLDPYLRGGEQSSEEIDLRLIYFGLMLEELRGAPPRDGERVLEALAAYGQLWDVADPEARPMLDELRNRGYRLGVVSNSDGRVERGLDRLGLREGLEVVVDSGAVGVEKPDPRIFEIALERLGIPAAEAVYVGDIPSIDLAGARATGLSFVLVDPLSLWPDSVDAPRLRRLADLPDLLDALG